MEKAGFKIEKNEIFGYHHDLQYRNCMLFQNNCAKIWNEIKKGKLRWKKPQLLGEFL